MISIRPVWPWLFALLMLAWAGGCDRTPAPAPAAPAPSDLPRTASTFTAAKKAL
jgi:hypothetical protein